MSQPFTASQYCNEYVPSPHPPTADGEKEQDIIVVDNYLFALSRNKAKRTKFNTPFVDRIIRRAG